MTREKPGLGPSPHARRDHSTAETGGRPILLPAVPSIWKRPVGEEGSRRPRHSLSGCHVLHEFIAPSSINLCNSSRTVFYF